MLNLRDALTYIFKERDWPLKFLLPFLLNLILIVPPILLGLSRNENFGSFNSSTKDFYSMNTEYSSMSLIYSCLVCFVIIPLLITSAWYMYENTRSGIFKRQTKAIWENKFEDTIKKTGKYLLTNFAYGMIFGLVTLVVLGVLFGIFCFFVAVIGGLTSQSAGTNMTFNDIASLGGAGLGLGIIILCCGIIVLFALYIAFYLLSTPAISRLIATNTFGEGMKVNENWKLGLKYKGRFFQLLTLTIVFGFVFGIISAFFSLFAEALYPTSRILGMGFDTLGQTIITLVSVYFGYFVYPRLLGQVFRSIIKDEEALNYIDLESEK